MPKTILIDKRNYQTEIPKLVQIIQSTPFLGLDTETQDSNRHQGLNTYCKYDEDGKKAERSKTVFDMRRTIMTGFSIWPENDSQEYYINLNHADIENRVPWEEARKLLDAKPASSFWVCHNASYEITAFMSCYAYDIGAYICTMQMAVSAIGPDEYPIEDFIAAGQGGMKALMPAILRESSRYEPDERGDLPPALAELVYKILSKQSSAGHSYNGFIKEIAYGYGLKALVHKIFKHKMSTFKETLDENAHMGQLTGEQTAEYGAEDAYWAMRLFRHFMTYMATHCPDTIKVFFEQENPMVKEYSNVWIGGLKVNVDAIWSRRDQERANLAGILRTMKKAVNALLPFDDDLWVNLDDAWYQKNGKRYRDQITAWARSPDSERDYIQCRQIRGPVSNGWSSDNADPEPTGPNFSHYMPIRVLMYDLGKQKVIRSEGKVQSDGEARGKLIDRVKDKNLLLVLKCLNEIASVEQRMKLYLTPYTLLMDPETGKLYSSISSMLASRRMAAQYPNPMQLAKRGESTYVRGFFEADHPDHVVVSVDWSSIELVEIGEFSADPEFIRAYGQIPHLDLHAGAAADILSVDVPGLTEEFFKDLRNYKEASDFIEHYGQQMTNYPRLFTDLKGQSLGIEKAYKYWRTEVGKGANFNYWYSGFLSTIGERMGWDMSKTGAATERYRERFHVAEQWRVDLIEEGKRNGYITLPDGHRRVRFEATPMWAEYFTDKFRLPHRNGDDLVRRFNAVIGYIARKIQGRANNQLVNSMIQGSCATIAKRSILRIVEGAKAKGWTGREFRFMMPIHDELVFSVHKDIVVEAIALIRGTMIDHPDIFKLCQLDASPSVGLTFEPWNGKKATTGQIELFEMPDIGIAKPNGRANDDEVRDVVSYLFDQRKAA